MFGRDRYSRFAAYVPVAERRRKAEAKAKQMAKSGRVLSPVRITGRQIATTFWGLQWCANLGTYSDYANRLPRGRTYAGNGSIIDLQIAEGKEYRLAFMADVNSRLIGMVDEMRGATPPAFIASIAASIA